MEHGAWIILINYYYYNIYIYIYIYIVMYYELIQ